MKPGRRLAFDYGQVRIGVAASDFSGLIASPIATLQAQSSDLTTQLVSLLAEYEPIYMVVGQPKHLSGSESATMESVRSFAELLKTLSDAPIHFIDERLSTVSAARTLRNAGGNAKTSKSQIDAMAAVAILESALDKERLSGGL
jgi:putative Holliday junction resolvase